LIAQRLALVAEVARYRHSEAEGTDRKLFDLVAAGLEAQLRDQRKSRRATQNANAEATTRKARTTKVQTARAASSPTIAP
jgi:hypothetical protein